MKAPIALALIVLGLTVGYLVITGKLPNNAVAAQANKPTVPSLPTPPPRGGAMGTGSGPFVAPQLRM